MNGRILFPPQQLPFNKKGKKWRKQVLDWADANGSFNYSPVRKSIVNKKINYDLLNGILHMLDLTRIVNPDGLKASFIPETIIHYPIMNSKLLVLRGEESKRTFDFKVVITNPNAISEIENNKKLQLFERLKSAIENTSLSEELLQKEILDINKYFTYEWQDLREIKSNALLSHYYKEYNIPQIFNDGFMDAMAVGEEMYQCDIVCGEPVVERINPVKIRIFRSGNSNKVEDADMIILEDYWSPGKVIDRFHEYLTEKDLKYLEDIPYSSNGEEINDMDEYNPTAGLINISQIDDSFGENFNPFFANEGIESSLSPYDTFGNIRVLRVYWKSKRKIKKVKSYDRITGDVQYNFYPETYVLNKDLGEEEEVYYINEAWEGTKIGKDIYVNMRPRTLQYNRLSNPSRCHFGIIGTIYNINDDKPFSLVDMMKNYNYYYDVVHDRLNKLIFRNLGKLAPFDFSKTPKGWDVDKWLYYAKTTGLYVIDGFKEGNIGAATGKLAGALNTNMQVIDAELGNSIQLNIQLLEYIKSEMSEVAGISKQREGQISNRETVGGVERATLQSSHITEWLFVKHEDLKKRVLECLLETAKEAARGNNLKFQHILPDYTLKIIEIDGDEFAEADYGLVVDNSNNALELNQKLDMLALAALLNQLLSFSTVVKLYNSSSLAEKQRMIEADETAMLQRQQEMLQLQLQVLKLEVLMKQEAELQKMQQEDMLNQRDNETKILIATINAESKQQLNDDSFEEGISEEAKEKIKEQIRQFNAKLLLERDKFDFEKKKIQKDLELKKQLINKAKSNK